MPPPESRKPPEKPQDESEKPQEANPPSPAASALPGRTGAQAEKAPEPIKDEEGNPIIAAAAPAPVEEEPEEDEDKPRFDRTVPGGRYQVGDKIVNAKGEVLEDAPKPIRVKK